ncbi:MAG: ABC transporter substrate-binding protein [Solirubrobacterales bacterium]
MRKSMVMAGSLSRPLVTLTSIALVAFAAALAGCGDDQDRDRAVNPATGGATASLTAGKAQRVADLVPPSIAGDGKIVVAMDASYPPNEFFSEDGKTIVGMDPDMAKALGEVMGLDVELENVTFDAILPGLKAGKFELAMSSLTDTKEREKAVDMVTYLTAGTKFYTAADSPTDIGGLADLCGKTVAIEKGTTQADDAAVQSKKCEAAGDKPVDIDVYPDQNGANLALNSGRAQVGMADSPVVAYIVAQSGGRLTETGEDYGTAPYGIAVNKDSGFSEAILAAVKALISGGQYAAILDKWNLADGGIDVPKVNNAVE